MPQRGQGTAEAPRVFDMESFLTKGGGGGGGRGLVGEVGGEPRPGGGRFYRIKLERRNQRWKRVCLWFICCYLGKIQELRIRILEFH